jgi:diguanylate cyclase (GGDEF)-like protein
MVDVDHFKRVNDTHGHHVGDEVLIAVAQALKAGVRRVDLVARYGGEEFCVLYSGVGDSDAARLAESLRRAVAEADGPVAVTASFGVCVHSGARGGRDAEGMLHDADAALYRAKREGRDRVAVAD